MAMSPDEFQEAWQSQPTGPQIHVDADLLLREVRHNLRKFRATIFWRDFREILAAVFVMGVSVFVAFQKIEEAWPWLLMGVGALWVAGYILVDRWRQRRHAAKCDDSLLSFVEESLRDVEHQIQLLKSVFWWYLLPLFLGGLVPYAYTVAIMPSDSPTWLRLLLLLGGLAIFGLVFWGVYRLNQLAVRVQLVPRRDELLAMRDSLVQAGD
jgi:hypothetical protein